jgi:hypothetical protein
MNDEAKRKLQEIQQSVAEIGYELTPDEIVDTIKNLNELALSSTGISLIDGLRLSTIYNEIPPPPPYKGWFDDEVEAKAFVKRAEAAHGVTLSVMPIANKKFV